MRSATLWAGSLVLLLAGCAGSPRVPEPVLRTAEVAVEVPVRCIPEMPARPDLRAPDVIARQAAGPGVLELGASYALLWDYAARLEAVAGACVAGAPLSPR